MADERYEEKDQTPTLIDGGQVDEAIVNTPPTEKGVFNTGITTTQIEQVVDLPIPTTDDSGKVLKVDAGGKWELATDIEGTVVVANPTLSGTETNLTGLQVGAIKYKVPQGMEVVDLSGVYGTLSDENFAKVSGNNCVVVAGGSYFTKASETESAIIYVSNDTDTEIGTRIIQKGNKEWVKGTKSIVIANPTLAGTEFALTGLQIGTTKYKVGGSEVVAYNGDPSGELPTGVEFTNWTLHRAINDGNILWIVLAGIIHNGSGNSQTLTSLCNITLPSDISHYIYREDGTTCDDAYSTSTIILTSNAMTSSQTKKITLRSLNANVIRIDIDSLSLADNTDSRIDFRIPLFLNIGTVQ